MDLAGVVVVMRVLTINAGSTSLKVVLVEDDVQPRAFDSVEAAAAQLAEPPMVVAHRLVHGGERTSAAIIDDAVRAELDGLIELDPLHEPPALDAVDQARRAWPGATHVACFDTAFHATIPHHARTYALPLPWREQLRGYGFHGLSHSWSARRLSDRAPDARRAVIAHLGGGSSLCGIVDGRSQLTTMGFTPLDGLVMANRAGSIDPGAVLWLTRHSGVDVDDLLTRRSGLLGLTGTADMQEVWARAERGDGAAQFALDVYEHRFVALLGGCVAALGGLDALVFTGGIGEHADGLRARLCRALGWLGLVIEAEPSAVDGDRELTARASQVRVFVITAREDLVMAREAWRLVHSTAG
jgi:acetate kinase